MRIVREDCDNSTNNLLRWLLRIGRIVGDNEYFLASIYSHTVCLHNSCAANTQRMPDNTNASAAASCPVANTPRSTTSSSDDDNEEDSDEEIGAMIYASSKTDSTASYQH